MHTINIHCARTVQCTWRAKERRACNRLNNINIILRYYKSTHRDMSIKNS